jgi:hypothetical protein
MARKLNVYIDGQNVGMIANNSTETYETSEGKKEVYVDMKGGKSEVLKVEVVSDTLDLVVGPSRFDTTATNIFLVLLPITFIIFSSINIYSWVTPMLLLYTCIYFLIRSILKVKAFEVRKI